MNISDYRRLCINCMYVKDHPQDVCPHCGFDPAAYRVGTQELPPYTLLNGKYILGRSLGAGGFGITYIAFNITLEHPQAIKEFFMRSNMYRDSRTDSAVMLTMANADQKKLYRANLDKFRKEAQLLAKLGSIPGIVVVHDFFEQNNTSYIVMEYLDGLTVRKYVRSNGGKLDYREALRKFHPVIESLKELHRHQIFHRDISPDNIMVLKNGSLKLFDFGGARVEGSPEIDSGGYEGDLSGGNPDFYGRKSSIVLVKEGYSPIEQYAKGEQGAWTDVYALAATIYYCLTGHDPLEAVQRMLDDKLVRPRVYAPDLPENIEKAVLKGMGIRKEDRHPDMEAFEKDLYSEETPAQPDGGSKAGLPDDSGKTPGKDTPGEEPTKGVNGSRQELPGKQPGGNSGDSPGRGTDNGRTPPVSPPVTQKNPPESSKGKWIAGVVVAAGLLAGVFLYQNNKPGSPSVKESDSQSQIQTAELDETAGTHEETANTPAAETVDTPAAETMDTPAAETVNTPAEEASREEKTDEEESREAASAEPTEVSGVSALYPDAEGVRLSASSYNAAAPDWTEYNDLIARIRSTTDSEERTALMHHAEDLLMATGAILPLYYYNDTYLQKPDVSGIYSSLQGYKYFKFATCPRAVLGINLASEPFSIDPALGSSIDSGTLDFALFEGLYTYNSEGALVPALCDPDHPYDISDDGTVYTFHLREGLRWSDGTPLTAGDFEYSWKRASADETAADYQYMFDCFSRTTDGSVNVTAADDHTLIAVLRSPCAYFLDLCAFSAYLPVPRASVEAAADSMYDPGAWCREAGFVTNGAYTMADWKHEESMTFRKNDNYYRAAEVTVPELHFMLSADGTAIYAAYQAGELDFADTVPADLVQDLLGSDECHVVDNLGTYFLTFNVNSGLFAGKTPEQAAAMRKAVSLLIDREYIAETIGQSGQKIATSFIPAGMSDGNGGIFKANTASYSFPLPAEAGYYPGHVTGENIQEAIALLKYAGFSFTNGILSEETPLSISYLVNNSTGQLAIAEAIQQDLAAIGIQVNIDVRDWNIFMDDRRSGNFELAREGWISDFNDPINMLEMWTTGSGNNDCQFGVEG